MTNCADGFLGWKNFTHHTPSNAQGCPTTGCPGCLGLSSIDPFQARATMDWNPNASVDRGCGGQPANANIDSDDSPIMLSSSTRLERDVRELKRYVRIFVNRQKDAARKNAIAMEWRTMALVLDRLFFFIYIATIGITVVTSLPRTKRQEWNSLTIFLILLLVCHRVSYKTMTSTPTNNALLFSGTVVLNHNRLDNDCMLRSKLQQWVNLALFWSFQHMIQLEWFSPTRIIKRPLI